MLCYSKIWLAKQYADNRNAHPSLKCTKWKITSFSVFLFAVFGGGGGGVTNKHTNTHTYSLPQISMSRSQQ